LCLVAVSFGYQHGKKQNSVCRFVALVVNQPCVDHSSVKAVYTLVPRERDLLMTNQTNKSTFSICHEPV
jgi:hypothetical protein